MLKNTLLWFFVSLLSIFLFIFFVFPKFFGNVTTYNKNNSVSFVEPEKTQPIVPIIPPLDTVLYDKILNELANNPPPKLPVTKTVKDPKTGEVTTITIPPKPTPPNLWPVKTAYPNAGAILPFSRIVAYYGNMYSTKMGALGANPPDIMLNNLEAEVKKWQEADPSIPVIPALHYIAVVAQGTPGKNGKYIIRMPDTEIDKVIAMATKIHAIVFLDVQLGFSNVQTEIPLLQKYLEMPNVHLGIDPEFSMKNGVPPGKTVGTLDATDINFASNYLANLVRKNNIPPKILVIHRYTEKMVTNYKDIQTMPEVQFVMDMDGWGDKVHKIQTYKDFIYPEPVQFTGFKLFYKNDTLTPGSSIMTPEEVLKLRPIPIYIQYQ